MNKQNNMTDLMKTIDIVLERIVWVNQQGDMLSLKDLLHKPDAQGNPLNIENLSRGDLIGAFTSLQIRHELFSTKISDLSNEELAAKIKDLIFFETKAILENTEVRIVENKVA